MIEFGEKNMNLVITGHSVRWRVYEKEKLVKHLGNFYDIPVGDIDSTKKVLEVLKGDLNYVYWRPNSDETNMSLYTRMQRQRDLFDFTDCKHINDVRYYKNYHAKELTFNIWKDNFVNAPSFITFENLEELRQKKNFDFPFLIRLNNCVNGKSSFLVFNEQQLENDYKILKKHYEIGKINSNFTKMIAVEYLDASKEDKKYTCSYRIISTDKKIITGYARLCELPKGSEFNRGPNGNWSAFTGKFKPWMAEDFVKYQKRCQQILQNKEQEILRAINSINMSAQGIDIIEDQQDNIYFLESQPGFSTGYANSPKPFYNPHYPELVKFLVNNEEYLKKEIPMYYNLWLNKENLFDNVMKSLK